MEELKVMEMEPEVVEENNTVTEEDGGLGMLLFAGGCALGGALLVKAVDGVKKLKDKSKDKKPKTKKKLMIVEFDEDGKIILPEVEPEKEETEKK